MVTSSASSVHTGMHGGAVSWAGPADGVVVVGPATQAWGRADQEPNHFPRRHLSPLGLLGCLHGSQLLSKKWKVKEEFKWSEGAHGGGEDGHSDALNVSLESVAGSYQRSHTHRGRLRGLH